MTNCSFCFQQFQATAEIAQNVNFKIDSDITMHFGEKVSSLLHKAPFSKIIMYNFGL